MQANSSFCFYFLFFINPVEVWGSPLSFQSRDLPNEFRVFWCPLPLRFGGGLACLGAGMLNTLKIILSWLQSRESGSPARSLTPSWGGKLVAGRGFGGWVGKGCAFAPAVLFSVRGLREPSQDGPAKREGGGISGGRGVRILGAS